jgi:hypothetical protein
MQERIQQAGIQAILHLDKHGDKVFVHRLFTGLSKGTRKEALGHWFLKYAAVKVNTDAASKKTTPLVNDKDKVNDVAGALAEPWYEALAEKALSAGANKARGDYFDITKAVQAVLNRAKEKPLVLNGKQVDEKTKDDMLKAMAVLTGGQYATRFMAKPTEPAPT